MIRPSSATGRMMRAPLPLNEILSKDGPLSRRNTAKKCIASPKRKASAVAMREKLSDLLFMDYLFHMSVYYHVDVILFLLLPHDTYGTIIELAISFLVV